jgi:hypothetical protein
MLHQRAKKVGFIDLERDYNSRQLCPCCNLPYEKTQIGLNEESKSFGFLGSLIEFKRRSGVPSLLSKHEDVHSRIVFDPAGCGRSQHPSDRRSVLQR